MSQGQFLFRFRVVNGMIYSTMELTVIQLQRSSNTRFNFRW